MTEGYIDSASTYEIISLLRCKQLDESYDWARHSAIEVTCCLFNSHQLKMAPAPSVFGEASGSYKHLMSALSKYKDLEHIKLNPQVEKDALEETKILIWHKSENILNTYEKMKKDQNNFSKWLEEAITYAWTEHSARLGGLFDFKFIPEISNILSISPKYLKQIWELSGDIKELEYYVINRYDKDEFQVMQDAYVISALIRGMYHEEVAKKSSLKIMHHPIRAPVLDSSEGKPKEDYTVSYLDHYLSKIILSSAFVEEKIENR